MFVAEKLSNISVLKKISYVRNKFNAIEKLRQFFRYEKLLVSAYAPLGKAGAELLMLIH